MCNKMAAIHKRINTMSVAISITYHLFHYIIFSASDI